VGVTFAQYAARAARKGLAFELTEESFDVKCRAACAYCRKEPGPSHRNGVDRVDNSRGYTEDNCVSCCSECNQMKGAMTGADFFAGARAVAAHLQGCVPSSDVTCLRCISARATTV